ncbi:CapA family protein [Sphingomonas sp. So64.6b]|uniref:CapA family protein n=1 Tax=Sphingomonas sp. So64.6b TaxID=2997354 RepID=UPI001AEDAAF5|nr:CapA family protein [Sphingomonas sp. So64.6b]
MPSKDPDEMLRAPRKAGVTHGDFDLISIGDLLYSHPMADNANPEFQKVLAIVRSGDVTIGNQEGVFMDLKTFKGEAYGPGQLWGEATLAKDMRAMGVDMVSVANNHSFDWGPEGLLETRRLLDAAGMVHSGGGASLEQARRAGILTTPKARVALVSVASSFKPNATANDPMGEVPARPGISTLRTRKIILITPAQMAMVRKLATELASTLAPAPPADSTEVTLGDQIYRLSDKSGLHYDMDLYDHAALLKAVRDGKDAADLLVFTIHAHESPTGFDDDTPAPPDFLIKLFHDVVDAGADVVMGGGPHSLRGIEIYKGQPIFYGMGVFFIKGEIKALQETAFQVFPDATGKAPPPEPPEQSVRRGGNPASWYDGMVASTEFRDGKPVLIRLYPLDVGNTYDRTRRGNPHLADPENARRILAMLQRESALLGTKIEIEGTTGVIRLGMIHKE